MKFPYRITLLTRPYQEQTRDPNLSQAYYIAAEISAKKIGGGNTTRIQRHLDLVRPVRPDDGDPYARPDPGELQDQMGGRILRFPSFRTSFVETVACGGSTSQSCADEQTAQPTQVESDCSNELGVDNVISIEQKREENHFKDPAQPQSDVQGIMVPFPRLEAVNRTIKADEKSHLISLMAYAVKVFGVDRLLEKFESRRKEKHASFDVLIAGVFKAIASGRQSMSELASSIIHPMTGKKVTRKRIEALFSDEEFAGDIYENATSVVTTMKRANMLDYDGAYGETVACVDGVETCRQHYSVSEFENAVARDIVCPLCNVAVKRDSKTKEVIGYETYHRLVLISALSTRGSIPLAWEFQTSDFGKRYRDWLVRRSKVMGRIAKQDTSTQERILDFLNRRKPDTAAKSFERAKQEGELTVLNTLLKRLQRSGRLPFDYIVGDGLYSKAGVGELVEAGGACLVAVMKEEARVVRKEADEDFQTRNPDLEWKDNKGRDCKGWLGEYADKNRKGKDKGICIVRVIRQQKEAKPIDNYFYCSRNRRLSPLVVETLRAGRWSIEDSFNCWSNRWGFLKHVFHHTERACRSILSFYFLVSSIVHNYRFGNLNRGKQAQAKASMTWKEFFEQIVIGANRLISLTALVEYAVAFGRAWRSSHSKRIRSRSRENETEQAGDRGFPPGTPPRSRPLSNSA